MTDTNIRKRSAGVIVFRETGHEPLCLLLRLYAQWDFPKGEIEAGEEPIEAAIREVCEETTISDLSFRWGQSFQETAPYNGKVARYYVAATFSFDVSLPVNPALGHPEHHEFRWMEYSAARRALPDRLRPILEWAYNLVSTDELSPGKK
ncbi:MAG: NUDIX domain-containing protein [Acidiferrobacteraceae bacterium]